MAQILFLGRPYTVFSDNAKYAFLSYLRKGKNGVPLYLTKNRAEYQLMHEAGLPVVIYNDTSNMERIIQKTDIIVSDCHDWKFEKNIWAAARQSRFINLWHGAPIKNLGMRVPMHASNQSFERAMIWPHAFTNLYAFVSTSKHLNHEAWYESFHAKHFPVLGYSRNDVLFREPQDFELLNVDIKALERITAARKAGLKPIIYAPTFRDNGQKSLSDLDIDVMALDALCAELGLLFCLKLHPILQAGDTINDCENIMQINSKSDVYPLLSQFEMMVTDYSSIYLDFLLLDRPVAFHCPDLFQYQNDDRGMCLDYDAITPGPQVTNFLGLTQVLSDFAQQEPDIHAARRERVCSMIHDHIDGGSGQRFVSYVDAALSA